MTGTGARGADENARYFDELAESWDSRMGLKDVSLRAIRAGLAALGLEPGDRILDAGCGTGALFPSILGAIGAEGTLIGLDVSERMLRMARRKHGAPNIEFVHGDIGEYLAGARAESLDAIACFQAFPHFDEKERLLGDFHRVLAEGGRFIVLHASGSLALNAFHATLASPVRDHELPLVGVLGASAERAGFSVREAREEKELYLLAGEKASLSA
jgi:ubiquinone/menaquinone biosynthesis C-methylase UbiE